MKKRLFATLLACAMTVSLVACGGSSSSSEKKEETGWETTIALIQQGIHEGTVRPIQIPILKTMMEATLEQFFQRDILITNQISYNEALEEVVNILVDGITR